MENNKELQGKFDKLIKNQFTDNNWQQTLAERLCIVAAEHYGDRWTRVEDGLPEEGHECVIMIAGMRGTAIYTEVDGVYQFVNENYKDSCAELEQDAITHWISITDLPAPPTGH